MTRFRPEALATAMQRRLDALGVAPESSRHVVASLLETSLRGVDSHGIRLFPHYDRACQAARVNGRPSMQLVASSPSTAVVDADHAFGHHAGAYAMDRALERARETGVGAVAVRHSTHFGAAAYAALRAARSGFVAFSFTNADALVRAAGATVPVFGTNPVCFAAPMTGEDPMCLDMATSTVSWNKILVHRRSGQPLEAGWADDEIGNPTTDAAAARMLEPSGGYKGFGLGMMVDVLCGLLAGGPVAREILPMFTAPLSERRSIGHFFVALDVERFVPLASFAARLKTLADEIRSLPAASNAVMVPGDPEKRTSAERSLAGIPVEDPTLSELLALGPDFAAAVVR
jgi:LDH2 family malate/lactate/ureidoglycolate dehydrogenase